MDQRAEIVDRPGSVEAKGIEGRLEFRCVSFSYPGSDTMILNDFNLTVAPGETVAIVGATGVGKSSIANLILRFYDVSAGSIVLDGRDIRDYTLASLRQAVGIVQQDVFLFARSIRDNIALGDETAPDEALREAAKKPMPPPLSRPCQKAMTVMSANGASSCRAVKNSDWPLPACSLRTRRS